jgi:hypothetical protein
MPISRVFDPYTGGAIGGGTGSAGAPTLGAATDPQQDLASSATSWTVEWPAATGGDGAYTYTITVTDQDGNSVVPTSGSDEGPYVIPVVTPNSYIATLEVEDGAGEVASSSAMARVQAAAAAAGWVTVQDYDLTGLDVATLTGTGYVQKSGVNFGPQYMVVDHASNLGTVSAGASGITVDGLNINSALQITFDILGLLPVVPEASPVWVDVVCQSMGGFTGGSDGFRVGLVDSSGNFSTGTCYDIRGDYVSLTPTISWRTETNGSTSTWTGTVNLYATNVFSCVLFGGYVTTAFLQQNSTTPPTSSTINAGGRNMAKTMTAGVTPYIGTSAGLRVGAGVIWRPTLTITRLIIRQFGGV